MYTTDLEIFSKILNAVSTSVLKSLNEGAWGYEPLDSDLSLDLRDDILDKLLKTFYDELVYYIKAHKNSGDRAYAIIGSILYFLQHFDLVYSEEDTKKLMELYDKCIEICESDTKWIQSWNDPSIIIYQLKNQKNKPYKYIIHK